MDSLPSGISAEYLSEVLLRCGVLRTGRISAVTVEDARNTLLSRIMRLRLAYQGDSGDAPPTLILKTVVPESQRLDWNAGQHEVLFYQKVAPLTPTGLLPRCFDAVSSADGMSWHLLLEDLATTHRIVTVWPLPPRFAEAARIVRARAGLHAAWWDHEALGKSIGTWTAPDEIAGVIERFEGKFAEFIERMGDLLTPERRAFYERLVDAAPRLYGRYLGKRHMTLVHGDGHFWNCFLSNTGDGVKFFDWDCWRIDVGSDDLACMIAMHWYPERRSRFERELLDQYHATLVEHGVAGYDRRALQDDYRLSVLWQAMTPVWQAAVGLPPQIWWNNYERIMMAVDDLDCRELLGGT